MLVLRAVFRRPRSMVAIRMIAQNGVNDLSKVMEVKERKSKSNKVVSHSQDVDAAG
jgi:hypothetical protein